MRYRPLGRFGTAVSAVSLRLDGERCDGRPETWLAGVHAAFEHGVNSFEIYAPTPALMEGFGEAAGGLERRLLCVNLRLLPGSGAEDIARQVAECVRATGLGHLDLVTLDADAETHTDAIWTLEELRATPKVRLIAVAGETEAVVQHIAGRQFDALIAPFNILSGWRERLRVRTAMENKMAVIASGHFPHDARDVATPAVVKKGWFSKPAPLFSDIGTYAFLNQTPGWTSEEICLAFTLTEPSLASVVLDVDSLDHLSALAEVTERELPAAVAAQIEMARFSAERQAGTERRGQLRRA